MDPAWAELARLVADQFAPVIYQDVADGLFNDADLRRRDLLTTVDFDGTLDPTDSADNLDDYPLPGAVYYDAVETETHWYLLYSLFHALDWDELGFIDHENDMEHVWLLVEKQVDGGLLPVALHTQAHGETFGFTELSGNFPAEAEAMALDGDHPLIFVESHGHGPAMCGFAGGLPYTQEIDCSPAADDDLVAYRVRPGAGVDQMVEPDVSDSVPVEAEYALVWAYESLWPVRGELEDEGGEPPMWDEAFAYVPGRNDDYEEGNDWAVGDGTWGADFAGDEGGGGGVPPWGYWIDDDYLGGKNYGARGDWLIDPAALFASMYRDYSCSDREAFFNYLGNPYASEVVATPNWTGVDEGRRCAGTIWPEDSGTVDTGEIGDSGGELDSAADSDGEDAGDTAGGDTAALPKGKSGECGCAAGGGPSPAGAVVAAVGVWCSRWRKRGL